MAVLDWIYFSFSSSSKIKIEGRLLLKYKPRKPHIPLFKIKYQKHIDSLEYYLQLGFKIQSIKLRFTHLKIWDKVLKIKLLPKVRC